MSGGGRPAAAGQAWGMAVWLSITGLLIFGTTTTVLAKTMYQVNGYGLSDDTHDAYHTFQKPWAGVLIMFMGMTFCLLHHEMAVKKAAKRRSEAELTDPLLTGASADSDPQTSFTVKSLVVIAPALADLIATVLMYLGLVTITASVYQMLRGAELVFAAIFAIVFLKRKLNWVHFVGICLNITGVTCVGMSSILSGSGSKEGESVDAVIMGMGLVVLSQMVQAGQVTFEDYFLANLNMKPMAIVGLEGLYGTLLMSLVILPAVYFLPGPDVGGRQENTLDSLELLKNGPILVLGLAQMFAMMMYNFAGMSVTSNLGAVFRTILETMRTIFVWAVDFVLFYGFPELGLGEGITPYTWLQAVGFVVLVVGTLVYDKGDQKAAAEEEAAAAAEVEGMPPSEPASYIAGAPMAVPTASQPMSFHAGPSSFKASMSLNAHSYSRASYTGSYMSPA
mmetsp:Transcript_38230/g.83160  ORF Transcript_38230/g.83160 Transcript_38230/m.83160 type:complete len:450 (-) Transcript_38230:4544-5893(-)